MSITGYPYLDALYHFPPTWAALVASFFVLITLSLSLFLLMQHLSAYKNPEVFFLLLWIHSVSFTIGLHASVFWYFKFHWLFLSGAEVSHWCYLNGSMLCCWIGNSFLNKGWKWRNFIQGISLKKKKKANESSLRLPAIFFFF